MTIYSATRPVFDVQQQTFYIRQFYWIGLSIICFFIVIFIDYRWIIRFAYLFYIFGLLLLVAVLFIGKEGLGAQRWISLGFLSFQPSEFFKLCLIVALAHYLSNIREGLVLDLKNLSKIVFLFFVTPAFLILKEPDLGTVMMLLFVFSLMVITSGVKKKIIVVASIIGVISLPFVGNIMWENLREYQKQRIIAFINPYVDAQGTGYHLHQSKVSIGSGGFWGKGYLKGTQGPLRFLPERHTDFIFSVFAEEWGFAGTMFLFFLYILIILKGFDTAQRARDPAGSFLALGVTYMFFFYFIINVGMTLGVVPVVGVPLPFMSYGGTALLINFLALGLLVNVRMRRFSLFY
jgi:rod shape determining protein RodA